MDFKILKRHRTFEGETLFCEHESTSTKTTMRFSAFLPAEMDEIDSALIWLSGLTCNEENFITKAGAQRCLAKSKTMIICPDTSPRGLNLEGEDESYDFGSGAGFYVNAQRGEYSKNYKMYDYIAHDIVNILKESFSVEKISIFGHSMGGHGALVIALRNSDIFSSVSAFSPIVNPMECPWGIKAFEGYLGDDKKKWSEYDATELVKEGYIASSPILIEQGTSDEFFKDQLMTDNLVNVCDSANQEIKVNYREGFDHSYYFIQSFLQNHIDFHLKYLK